MTFISYAQNFEDVILRRALQGVKEGFYIDVGANDPVIDSVTKAFYDLGWHGINVEPVSVHHLALQEARPRDINLHCALGPESGDRDIWQCEVRGWATLDVDVAKMHESDGYAGAWKKTSVKTLKEICLQFPSSQIHFLKIDVEGYEAEVLKGMDFSAHRPWVVVIEAVALGMSPGSYTAADQILQASGYVDVYTDGLNRFYVAREREELLGSFKYPPNVFDDFVRHSECVENKNLQGLEVALQRAEVAETLAKIELSEARYMEETANDRAGLFEQKVEQLERELVALNRSRSWRLTAPLRGTIRLCRRLGKQQVLMGARRVIRKCARAVASRAVAHQRVKETASKMLERTPRLKSWLRRLVSNDLSLGAERGFNRHYRELSPRAEQFFVALKTALESRNERVK